MKVFLSTIFLFLISGKLFAQTDYTASVTFPAGYAVGDYVEFVKVAPIDAGSSGNYEISISYTRGNVAAAATHLASLSHANPDLWREVGKINDNPYTAAGNSNFTIDCNTLYGNPRFRIRAVNTLGVLTSPLVVNIKVHSNNSNSAYTALSATGNDLTVTKFLAMTDVWTLYVGNNFSTNGAALAIKAIENGNVGIGTANPDQKLAVNGTVHAKAVLVDVNVFPDFVFDKEYQLPSLTSIKTYIDKNHHLPEIPPAAEVIKNGQNLGELNSLLLKKVEELTLYMIEKDKQIRSLEQQKEVMQQQTEILQQLQAQICQLKKQVEELTNAKK